MAAAGEGVGSRKGQDFCSDRYKLDGHVSRFVADLRVWSVRPRSRGTSTDARRAAPPGAAQGLADSADAGGGGGTAGVARLLPVQAVARHRGRGPHPDGPHVDAAQGARGRFADGGHRDGAARRLPSRGSGSCPERCRQRGAGRRREAGRGSEHACGTALRDDELGDADAYLGVGPASRTPSARCWERYLVLPYRRSMPRRISRVPACSGPNTCWKGRCIAAPSGWSSRPR